MTDFALSPQGMAREGDNPPSGPEPVKPGWLRSVTTVLVIAAHVMVFGILAYSAKPTAVSLNSVSMDLVPEGDFFEQEEVAEADDTPPPEAVEEPDIALPPPVVMAPDAVPLPAKKEDVDKVKKKVEQQQVQRAQQRQEAQARRRYGAPEGQAGKVGRIAGDVSCPYRRSASPAYARQHQPWSRQRERDVPRQCGRWSVGHLGFGVDSGACGARAADRVLRTRTRHVQLGLREPGFRLPLTRTAADACARRLRSFRILGA